MIKREKSSFHLVTSSELHDQYISAYRFLDVCPCLIRFRVSFERKHSEVLGPSLRHSVFWVSMAHSENILGQGDSE